MTPSSGGSSRLNPSCEEHGKAFIVIAVKHIGRSKMGATTLGALVGGAIDSMSGDDSAADGAIIGAIAANVLKVAVPIVITYAIGWAALKGAGEILGAVTGKSTAD